MALTDAQTRIASTVEELDADGVVTWRFEALRNASYGAAEAADDDPRPDAAR